MDFIPGRRPERGIDRPAWCLVVDDGRVLVRQGDRGPAFPEAGDLRAMGLQIAGDRYLGATQTHTCFLEYGDASEPVPPGFAWVELRSLFGAVEETLFWIAGRAHHLALWEKAHRRCGACGGPMALKEDEWARTCPSCGQTCYPQICPAVIVSVVDGDRILLARNRLWRHPFFSVLAGFVEPGEDLESAVRREIREEVGLAVRNLRYFGSQPWPFPNSLMIAFTAEYAGGEIDPDPTEILEARWFTRGGLPEIPSSASIARKLIDAFAG